MSVSTATQAKRRILDILDAAPAFADTTLAWAGPTDEDSFDHEMVYLGKVEQREEWASLGAHARAEEYTIELVCQVWRDGDGPESTEQDCWAIQSAVSTALRADKDLDGLLTQYAELQSTEMTTLPTSPTAWLARARCAVHCVARI